MRSSGLKENEINDLMAELTRNLAVAEEKIGLEQERQRRVINVIYCKFCFLIPA